MGVIDGMSCKREIFPSGSLLIRMIVRDVYNVRDSRARSQQCHARADDAKSDVENHAGYTIHAKNEGRRTFSRKHGCGASTSTNNSDGDMV